MVDVVCVACIAVAVVGICCQIWVFQRMTEAGEPVKWPTWPAQSKAMFKRYAEIASTRQWSVAPALIARACMVLFIACALGIVFLIGVHLR